MGQERPASDMDYFVSELQIVLPVLGVNEAWFPSRSRGTLVDTVSPVFRLRNTMGQVDASAQQIDGEFTMLAGSYVVATWHSISKAASTVKQYNYFRARHHELLDRGDIVVEKGRCRLTRNVVFKPPSLAGTIALGRSCNGRREWISDAGEMLGDWEVRGV